MSGVLFCLSGALTTLEEATTKGLVDTTNLQNALAKKYVIALYAITITRTMQQCPDESKTSKTPIKDGIILDRNPQ